MTAYQPNMGTQPTNNYVDDGNQDLDQFFNFSQNDGMSAFTDSTMYGMYNAGGFYPHNGTGMNPSLMQSQLSGTGFQASTDQVQGSFDFNALNAQLLQQVNPAAIMANPQPQTQQQAGHILTQNAASQQPAGGENTSIPDASTDASEPAQEPAPAKPKRTRQSKKKKLSQEEQDKKRKEFLERNRQAASKCRSRKQEATAKLQQRAQNLNLTNAQMRETVEGLQLEVMQMAKLLLNHTDCKNPAMEAAVAHYRLKAQSGAGFGDTELFGQPFQSASTNVLPRQAMNLEEQDLDAMKLDPCSPVGDVSRHSSTDSGDARNWMPDNVRRLTMSSDSSIGSRSSAESPGYQSNVTTPISTSKEGSSPLNDGPVETFGDVPSQSFASPHVSTLIDPSLAPPLPMLAQQYLVT